MAEAISGLSNLSVDPSTDPALLSEGSVDPNLELALNDAKAQPSIANPGSAVLPEDLMPGAPMPTATATVVAASAPNIGMQVAPLTPNGLVNFHPPMPPLGNMIHGILTGSSRFVQNPLADLSLHKPHGLTESQIDDVQNIKNANDTVTDSFETLAEGMGEHIHDQFADLAKLHHLDLSQQERPTL